MKIDKVGWVLDRLHRSSLTKCLWLDSVILMGPFQLTVFYGSMAVFLILLFLSSKHRYDQSMNVNATSTAGRILLTLLIMATIYL